MLQDITYKYYHKLNTKTVYLVLHGGGPEGVESPFISNIITELIGMGNGVFGFNFPYCERGEENSSGSDLAEETITLDIVIRFLRNEGYKKIVIVAKSLGGIIASYWLDQHADENVEVIVLGYVIGSVKTEALKGRLHLVIQGESDRFGNADAVDQDLARYNIKARVIEVPKADHSYRNESKEPVYQDQVVQLLVQRLSSI
jgi:predicted alpha/beta-hydrolase family hydrolase